MNEMGYFFSLVKIDEIDNSPLKLTSEQGEWFDKVSKSVKKKRERIRFRREK